MKIVNDLTPEHLAYWRDFDASVCTFTAPAEREVGDRARHRGRHAA